MFVMEPLKSMEAVLPDAATHGLELVCPAGSLPALKAAVDHGANCVYLGLRDATNARNFAGLNFDEAINFYREQFGIVRAVLPRVLSMDQVRQVIDRTPVEIEVFGFGSLCVMVEGRCALSSYVTGESPNTHGVCSPPKAVRRGETPQGRESRLNGVLIGRYAPGENAGY